MSIDSSCSFHVSSSSYVHARFILASCDLPVSLGAACTGPEKISSGSFGPSRFWSSSMTFTCSSGDDHLVGGGYLPLWKMMDFRNVGMIISIPNCETGKSHQIISNSMVPVCSSHQQQSFLHNASWFSKKIRDFLRFPPRIAARLRVKSDCITAGYQYPPSA